MRLSFPFNCCWTCRFASGSTLVSWVQGMDFWCIASYQQTVTDCWSDVITIHDVNWTKGHGQTVKVLMNPVYVNSSGEKKGKRQPASWLLRLAGCFLQRLLPRVWFEHAKYSHTTNSQTTAWLKHLDSWNLRCYQYCIKEADNETNFRYQPSHPPIPQELCLATMLRPVFSEDCRLQKGSGIVQQKGFKKLSMNKMAKSHAAEKTEHPRRESN